ncbi:hypothetical protein HGM15179_015768 [Zosterops borbonicus]|uniref:Uncharacterized protein n=1 Tax=Zosterops borbonicus TaxID=364589 RepID=A0A8K1G430_9PASS|nr:hypothetical protein HGM15179_015768 [Zosterops borbonicus]
MRRNPRLIDEMYQKLRGGSWNSRMSRKGRRCQGCSIAKRFSSAEEAAAVGQGQPSSNRARDAMIDLWDKVAKYGLGSSEVMQMIRVMNTDILAPYDIRHLAQVLFQPVQLEVFESIWNQFAIKVIAQNSQLILQDPRCVAGVDVFTGVGKYTDPDVQAGHHQLVLE